MYREDETGPDRSRSRDPLEAAVSRLFGLPYLFPYQRLVISNILEAAAALGISVTWPEECGIGNSKMEETIPQETESQGRSPAEEHAEDEGEAEAFGRQIVILPTGAGKSLCFQFPALLLGGPTLVIYPILSLMADQERRLRDRKFKPVILRGGQSPEERRAIWNQAASGESRFIIANPEVLLSPAAAKEIKKLGIVHVVIDEAHCVSEWGESFRPDYLRIGEIIGNTGARIITAFTATASAGVLEKIEAHIFRGRGAHRIIGSPDRPNISYAAKGTLFRDFTVKEVLETYPRPGIVFCSSRSGTERLARYLRENLGEREIRFYHAGLSREEKKDTEEWFFASPGGILTATCAYGMGIDKANIRTVIHRDCPSTVEAYLQEAGRAGRDGAASSAVLLWGPEDEGRLRRIKNAADRIRFEDLKNYARNIRSCRREQLLSLLNYEGELHSAGGECCDVCRGAASEKLREEDNLVCFIAKNRRRYTLQEAAACLASEDRGISEENWKMALEYLLAAGKVKRYGKFLWKNRIGARSQRPLPGKPEQR